ncbi:class I SAM-dependent methyltransferase [Patescibacteria group bacterium]|nr:class I SAM-dependent methyltransferase [Patescibacteria group bacterium]
MESVPILYPDTWTEYELIDTGDGEKLERFNTVLTIRPDPRIIWKKSEPATWKDAHALYRRHDETKGSWEKEENLPTPWLIHYRNLTMVLRPSAFKHVGIFPEQAVNWDWCTKQTDNKPLRILNLFAYTGGATLAAAAAGAHVTHVDSVKSTIAWARENAKLSSLDTKPVRWIEDDAYAFVLREGRRGTKYDALIMDPPRFGRGPKGQVWKLENDLPKMLAACTSILSPNPAFILINAYTADLSSIALGELLADFTGRFDGRVDAGELALRQSRVERLLPSGIFARWTGISY